MINSCEDSIKPEIVAAICASINIILDEEKKAKELASSVGRTALRINRLNSNWTTYGRQKIMDGRL